MKPESSRQLQSVAREILLQNRRDGFTIPCHNLYPFQWNWDSGFVSLGLGYLEVDFAIEELQSLFSGQWANGMIPHIIFHSENETTYFPNFDFWKAEVNAGAPQKPKTSGISQPPVHGFVLEALLERHPDAEKLRAFARAIYPKMVQHHRFWYTYRDPEREGLAFIFHPWESGRDNSPLWDPSMDRIVIEPGTLPPYPRRDTSHADAAERPTSAQYDRYVYLLELGKRYAYDGREIFEESPFLIQDTLINALLIRSNESLIRIGKDFGFDTGELEEWQVQSIKAFNEKLWDEQLNFYTCYDLRGQMTVPHLEIGGLTPLYAGLPDTARAQILADYLDSLRSRNYRLCPSFDVDDPLFDSKRYWRGPIWPQMNWLIYQGLKRYNYPELAAQVRTDLLDLVGQLGFYEYFESDRAKAAGLSKGYGGNYFSWTASSILDLIHHA